MSELRSQIKNYFQDPRNPVGVICTDERFFAIRPEIVISRDQVRTLRQTRTGAVVGVFLAKKYGWKNDPERVRWLCPSI